MIVCLCKGVSDRRLLEEARRGHRTLAQVRRACGACTGCGACAGQVKEILRRAGAHVAAHSDGSTGR
ncbi:MAG: (2Fe-2S)-binding protein [Deltaproteobacteria bacterium]|nr:MAG: (2Fe-2S)-binding protein [Deltaproteobacteria bacterium]